MPFAPAVLRRLTTLSVAAQQPANAGRSPGVIRRSLPYSLAVVLSLAVLIPGQRLTRADLDAPFTYTDDALLILPLAKATVERGSHWRNERLGYPGVQESHDFPVVDHLHFASIWAVGQCVGDPVQAFNLYHLLTYPLTTLAGLFVLRRLGLSASAALCGGLLYAFLPYHYRRGENHYFLSAYFVVPFTLLVTMWAADAGAFATRRRTIAAIVISIATASAGAYYAFFGCALLAAAALYAMASWKSIRAALGGIAAVGVVFVAGVANHAPAIVYQAEHGRNSAPHARPPAESETFALKVVQLVLPTLDHHSKKLDDVRKKYDTPDRPLLNENESVTLGLVGTAGFTYLLAMALLPLRKTSPVGPAAVLVLVAVLVGTVGGLGAIFSQLVSPQVRSYNRIAVYIAFLSLFAVLRGIDQFLAGRAWLRVPVFLAVAAFGLWDQTPKTWFTHHADDDRKATADRWRTDAAFFAAVEKVNPEAKVLCLPFAAWPEDRYEHVRGYLHTKSLVWSFGAMKGREADKWLREVCTSPADAMLCRAVLRGFDGLLYDARLCDQWHPGPTLAEVRAAVGNAPAVTHPDAQQVYFDLRPYRERLKKILADKFDSRVVQEAEAVSVLWLDGFRSFEPNGREDHFRWCGTRGELWFVNPTDRPRTLKIAGTFSVTQAAYADLKIESAVWNEHLALSAIGTRVEQTITIPPGGHRVRFTTKPAADVKPHWLGELLRVADFTAVAGD